MKGGITVVSVAMVQENIAQDRVLITEEKSQTM
jgi:hypothetical protein